MPHGEWLIPDDWNLETGQWEHYCIEWPKSFLWYIQLKSLMFALTRGREWDEGSGSIQTAQAIGWEIFKRNHLLLNLCGDQDGSPDSQNGLFPAFGGMEGIETMPCIDISGMLKIENGILYARDSCCEWVEIGAIAGLNEGVPDDPLNPTADPDFTYSACGKAKAVVDAIYLIVQSGYSAIAEPYPWQILPYVEDTVGYDLDNNQLFGMFFEIGAGLALGIEQSDVNDPVERQRILCRVVREFADDSAGVPTSDKFEAIKACFKAEMFPFSLWWGMYEYAINALGRVDMNTIAKLGAADTSADCDCPDVQTENSETTPDANGWYLGVDIHSEVTYTAPYGALWNGTISHDVYGVFMRLSVPPAADPTKRMSAANFHDAHPELMPVIGRTAFADTSDHLEVANLAYPIIQLDSAAIAVSLTAQRGFMGATRLTSGIDSTIIASPEWPAAENGGLYLSSLDFGQAGKAQPGFVLELRWIHNTGSPSHA